MKKEYVTIDCKNAKKKCKTEKCKNEKCESKKIQTKMKNKKK